MLVLAYVALAVLGSAYVLFSMLIGHYSDAGAEGGADGGGGEGAAAHHHGAEYGIDHTGHAESSASSGASAAFHFPFFSPLAIATLMGSLGALGLIAHFGLKLTGDNSLLVAVPGSILITYAVTYVGWRIVGGSSATSTIRTSDLVGAEGEVITPIPPEGIGEVAASVNGQRFAGPAREAQGRPVARGARVRVVRLLGSTLIVEAAAAPSTTQVSGH